jgi:hypothetical protein
MITIANNDKDFQKFKKKMLKKYEKLNGGVIHFFTDKGEPVLRIEIPRDWIKRDGETLVGTKTICAEYDRINARLATQVKYFTREGKCLLDLSTREMFGRYILFTYLDVTYIDWDTVICFI